MEVEVDEIAHRERPWVAALLLRALSSGLVRFLLPRAQCGTRRIGKTTDRAPETNLGTSRRTRDEVKSSKRSATPILSSRVASS